MKLHESFLRISARNDALQVIDLSFQVPDIHHRR